MRSVFRKDFNGAFGFHVQVFLEFQLYLSTSVLQNTNFWVPCQIGLKFKSCIDFCAKIAIRRSDFGSEFSKHTDLTVHKCGHAWYYKQMLTDRLKFHRCRWGKVRIQKVKRLSNLGARVIQTRSFTACWANFVLFFSNFWQTQKGWKCKSFITQPRERKAKE